MTKGGPRACAEPHRLRGCDATGPPPWWVACTAARVSPSYASLVTRLVDEWCPDSDPNAGLVVRSGTTWLVRRSPRRHRRRMRHVSLLRAAGPGGAAAPAGPPRFVRPAAGAGPPRGRATPPCSHQLLELAPDPVVIGDQELDPVSRARLRVGSRCCFGPGGLDGERAGRHGPVPLLRSRWPSVPPTCWRRRSSVASPSQPRGSTAAAPRSHRWP